MYIESGDLQKLDVIRDLVNGRYDCFGSDNNIFVHV